MSEWYVGLCWDGATDGGVSATMYPPDLVTGVCTVIDSEN